MRTAIEQAGKWLVRREHFISEMRVRLAAASFKPAEIEDAIQFLVKNNYLNDKRSAEQFVNLANQKGWGVEKLVNRLRHFGAAEEDIDQVVKLLTEIWSEEVRALSLAHQMVEKGKNRSQVYRTILSKGFGIEAAEYAVHQVFEDPSE